MSPEVVQGMESEQYVGLSVKFSSSCMILLFRICWLAGDESINIFISSVVDDLFALLGGILHSSSRNARANISNNFGIIEGSARSKTVSDDET